MPRSTARSSTEEAGGRGIASAPPTRSDPSWKTAASTIMSISAGARCFGKIGHEYRSSVRAFAFAGSHAKRAPEFSADLRQAMSQDNIFREIDEELRSDRMRSLWRRFAPYVIGAAVGVVVLVAANEGWNW